MFEDDVTVLRIRSPKVDIDQTRPGICVKITLRVLSIISFIYIVAFTVTQIHASESPILLLIPFLAFLSIVPICIGALYEG